MLKTIMIALLLSLAAVGPVSAACVLQTQCDSVSCQQIPICDSIAEPPHLPVGPMGSPAPVTPPPGSTCHQQKICDNFGKCTFRNLCR